MRILQSFLLISALASSLSAQTYGVLPGTPRAQFLDSSGHPLFGGCVATFLAGTSTPTPTWQDSNGSAANTNPVTLDSGGRAGIWLNTSLSYKIQVTAAPLVGSCTLGNLGVVQWTVDGVTAIGGTGGGGGGTFLPLAGGTMTGSILVGTTNTIDLGSSSAYWRSLYLGTSLFMGSNQILDGSGNATLHNVTVTGTCTGCGGAGTFLPLAGGTMTGNILVNPTDTVSLGSNSSELNKIWVKDINITGTCSGPGCGGGGSFLPLSGGTMSGNIQSSAVNVYSVGSKPNPFSAGFFANNVSTEKLEIYPVGATDLTGAFWNIQDTVDVVTKQMYFKDDSNNVSMILTRLLGGVSNKKGEIDGNWYPYLDGVYELGSISQRWLSINFGGNLVQNGTIVLDAAHNASVNNLTITGTCSGCPGSGSGTYLPIAGGTMTGSILSSTVGTLVLGSVTNPFSGVYALGNVNSRKFQIYDPITPDLTTANWSITADASGTNHILHVKDTAGNDFLYLQNLQFGSAANPYMAVAGGIVAGSGLSGANNNYDLGSNTDSWRNLYLGTGLYMGATQVLDSARNATVANLTVSGTCTGCSGGGSFLPLAGGTMTGSILGNNGIGIGDVFGHHFGVGVFGTSVVAPFFRTILGAPNSVTDFLDIFKSTGVPHLFQVQNSSAQGLYRIDDTRVFGNPTFHEFSGSIVSLVGSNSGDLGSSSDNWRTLYLGTSLVMGSQPVINSLAQFVGAGVDVGTNGISAGGYNVSGGFIGQTATISGLGCGSLHFTAGIFTGCF